MILTTDQQQELAKIVKGRIAFNEPMSDHTTIKIGGPADVWFEPSDADDLVSMIKWSDERGISRFVFGNGSNTLVRDLGIRGVVISLAKFNHINVASEHLALPVRTRGDWGEGASLTSEPFPPLNDEVVVTIGAGVSLAQLVGWSIDNSCAGLEPLAGIPGTVGGAVAMNAGTKEGTIGDVVAQITIVSGQKQSIRKIDKENLKFAYRKLTLPKGGIVVEAVLKLAVGNKQEIESKINKIRNNRKDTQPLLWPSLGSVFKNPEGAKAWELIDDCGLRNVRIGSARIANEHANWIVNEGKATAKDVEVLIKMIRDRVREKTDFVLEPEIIIVGE